MSKAERYRQIIEQTRVRFLQDAATKMQDLHQGFASYMQSDKPSPQAGDTMVDQVHRHVHAIKGLALTLSYPRIDELCGDILHYILNDPPIIWEWDHIVILEQKVHQLELLLSEAASSKTEV